MTNLCKPKLEVEPPNRKINWDDTTKTLLKKLVEKRSSALAALSDATNPRPVSDVAKRTQEYWEGIVAEAGQLAFLQPNKLTRATNWLANIGGIKLDQTRNIREPLLDVKRLVEGNLREAGIYNVMQDMTELADLAKKMPGNLGPEDFRRIVEEGLTPQRLAVYGNTPEIAAKLNQRFVKLQADMLEKGINEGQLRVLLDKAQQVSSHWDNVRAVALSTGLDVGELVNIGYFPRAFTKEARKALGAVGGLKNASADELMDKLVASRNTWEYIPADRAMISSLLDVAPTTLDDLVSNPVKFATFLSERVDDEMLDLLVDSGLMSKVPMLTTDLGEYLALKYKVPFTSAEMFVTDPLQASNVLINRLSQGSKQSALVKFLDTEGMKAGWAIPPELRNIAPQEYADWVHIKTVIPTAEHMYIPPAVADNLRGILRISSSPAEMSKAAAVIKWWKTNFSVQALGNPVTAPTYLTGQLLSNMASTMGRGGGVIDFATSLMDVAVLTSKGLKGFDNTKPFRYLDGKAVTHREFVGMVMRKFSHQLLPGIDVTGTGAALFDMKQLSPKYTRAQLARIVAMKNNGFKALGTEIAAVLGEKSDAIFLPTLRIASMIDMAGQLAVARAKASLGPGYSKLKAGIKDLDQGIFGWTNQRYDTWEEVSTEVKRAFPMFDDAGKFAEGVSLVMPFKTWAIQNLPLQIADMMRQPSRWYNYARMSAIWNDAALGEDVIVEGELQDWERKKYGIIMRTDPATKQTVMLMPDKLDPRYGALTWLANLSDGTQMKEIRDKVNGNQGALFNELVGQSYFGGVYKYLSGVDPNTGLTRDESENAFKQFMGVPMSPNVAALLSISPVLASLDRLPVISGRQALLDPRTDEVIRPAVNGWLGNQGTLRQGQLTNLEETLQTLGAPIRYVDRLNNMRYTWRDTERTIGTLIKEQQRLQTSLAEDLSRGSVTQDSESYKARVKAINKTTDAILQINYDLGRIERWAIANQVPPDEALAEMRKRRLVMKDIPLPGADYVTEQMEAALNKIELEE